MVLVFKLQTIQLTFFFLTHDKNVFWEFKAKAITHASVNVENNVFQLELCLILVSSELMLKQKKNLNHLGREPINENKQISKTKPGFED